MARSPIGTEGKTSFVKEYLNDHPTANPKAVNVAWTEAGMSGSLSASLVNKMRSSMGLTGNLRSKSRKSKSAKKSSTSSRLSSSSLPLQSSSDAAPVKRRGRPAKVTVVGSERLTMNPRSSQIAAVEADLDRLLFSVMSLGKLTRLEESLREARRVLYKNYL